MPKKFIDQQQVDVDAQGHLKVDPSDFTQPISAVSLPLPDGASSQTTLAGVLTELQGKADLAETQPISAASLPLPTGAASEATVAAVKTAVEIIDNFISGARGLVTEDSAIAIKTAVEIIDNFISGSRGLVTEDNSAAIKTAVELIDNMMAGSEAQVDVITLPSLIAGTARVGATYPLSGQLVDENGTVRTVSRAFANATLSGNTQVVAAQGAGVKIRVLSYTVVCLLAVTIKFQSGTTDISAGYPFAINGGVAVPYNPHGLFETAANEALNINLSLGTTVGVTVIWIPAT